MEKKRRSYRTLVGRKRTSVSGALLMGCTKVNQRGALNFSFDRFILHLHLSNSTKTDTKMNGLTMITTHSTAQVFFKLFAWVVFFVFSAKTDKRHVSQNAIFDEDYFHMTYTQRFWAAISTSTSSAPSLSAAHSFSFSALDSLSASELGGLAEAES